MGQKAMRQMKRKARKMRKFAKRTLKKIIKRKAYLRKLTLLRMKRAKIYKAKKRAARRAARAKKVQMRAKVTVLRTTTLVKYICPNDAKRTLYLRRLEKAKRRMAAIKARRLKLIAIAKAKKEKMRKMVIA